MPSQSSSIYIILSGLIAAIISGIFSLRATSVNNKFQLERENKQLEREEKQRIWQEESDQKKWYREKIYDSYRASIQALTKIIQMKLEINRSSIVTEDKHTMLTNLRIEFASEFSILIAGHPDKDSKEFTEKTSEVFDESLEKNPWVARIIITEMMENDSRIKNINK